MIWSRFSSMEWKWYGEGPPPCVYCVDGRATAPRGEYLGKGLPTFRVCLPVLRVERVLVQWCQMVERGVRGLYRLLRRLRLVRCVGFPVIRLGKRRALGVSVCA